MCIIEIIIESLKPYISDICSIIGLPGWYTSPSSGSPAYRTGIPLLYHFGRHLPRLPGTLVAAMVAAFCYNRKRNAWQKMPRYNSPFLETTHIQQP